MMSFEDSLISMMMTINTLKIVGEEERIDSLLKDICTDDGYYDFKLLLTNDDEQDIIPFSLDNITFLKSGIKITIYSLYEMGDIIKEISKEYKDLEFQYCYCIPYDQEIGYLSIKDNKYIKNPTYVNGFDNSFEYLNLALQLKFISKKDLINAKDDIDESDYEILNSRYLKKKDKNTIDFSFLKK